MTHKLKTWPAFFHAVRQQKKGFELRKDDRDFKVGDTLILEEYDPSYDRYTGQVETRLVTFVARDIPDFGLKPGYAILSIEVDMKERDGRG